MGHTMGAAATGGMDALLNPTTMEGLDAVPSSGQQFEAELAYGFSAHNDRLTLTPAVVLALSPTNRTYSLLWSLAPHAEPLQGESWELSLAGEWQEQAPMGRIPNSPRQWLVHDQGQRCLRKKASVRRRTSFCTPPSRKPWPSSG